MCSFRVVIGPRQRMVCLRAQIIAMYGFGPSRLEIGLSRL